MLSSKPRTTRSLAYGKQWPKHGDGSSDTDGKGFSMPIQG